MSKTERDPLFFPPSKYPEEGEQPEEYSAEIDPKAQQKGLRLVSIIALVLLGFILIGIRPAWLHAPWRGAASGLDGSPAQSSGDSAEISEQQADRFATLPPQQQVETLLQLALRGKPGAPSQILQRAEAWRGKISVTQGLLTQLDAALRSNDLQLRNAAVEIELAAYNLPRTAATAQSLIARAEADPATRPASLWMMGLIGSRGIAVDRISESLLSSLHDPRTETRIHAVDALAILAAEDSVPALLEALHNDASTDVRKRAAAGLAHAGLLDHDQRLSAVPVLVRFSAEPALDPVTRGLVFQILRELTSENLPDDASSWQRWYAARK